MKDSVAKSIEELHISQRARELTNAVYALTREATFSRDRGLVDQIRRATVSIHTLHTLHTLHTFTPFTPSNSLNVRSVAPSWD